MDSEDTTFRQWDVRVAVGQVELHVIALRLQLTDGAGGGVVLEGSRACRPRQSQRGGGRNAEGRGANRQTSHDRTSFTGRATGLYLQCRSFGIAYRWCWHPGYGGGQLVDRTAPKPAIPIYSG